MSSFSLKALLAVTLWGLSFVATRIALGWLTPIGLVCSRLVIGWCAMAAFARMGGCRSRLCREDALRCALLGLILAVHLLIQNIGLLKTTATNTGWIIGFIPATIAVGARLFLREKLPVLAWIGIAIGACGVGMVSLSGGFSLSDAKIGDALQLASCVTWTAYTLLAVGAISRSGARKVTQRSFSVAAIVVAMFCAFLPVVAGEMSVPALCSVVFLGVLSSGIAYIAWFAAVREIGSSATGAYLYLEPFVTMAAATTVIREPVAGLGVAGGMTVIAGVWLVARSKRVRRDPRHEVG